MRTCSTRWAWLAAVIAVVLAQACVRSDEPEARVVATCSDYCEQARACDVELDADECRDRCEGIVADCRPPELEQALDDLDHCAVAQCDEISDCPVGAGLHCTSEL